MGGRRVGWGSGRKMWEWQGVGWGGGVVCCLGGSELGGVSGRVWGECVGGGVG